MDKLVLVLTWRRILALVAIWGTVALGYVLFNALVPTSIYFDAFKAGALLSFVGLGFTFAFLERWNYETGE